MSAYFSFGRKWKREYDSNIKKETASQYIVKLFLFYLGYTDVLCVLVGTLTFCFIQNHFTHTHALRSNFYVFIFFDVFQSFLQ